MSQPAPNTESPIRVRQEGAIARVGFNEPDRYNPLRADVIEALHTALDAIAADDSIRVVILDAEGKAFSAGHDLREVRSTEDRAAHQALFERCSAFMQRIVSLPQPVIAQVQGIATAAGCQLVATADLAVAGRSARFATSGINLGLFCSTPAVAVSRVVPRKNALEMLFTGDFVDAEEAARLGLVNRVVDDDALAGAATELAEKIAARPPEAIQAGKALFYRQSDKDLAGAYTDASETMACNMDTEAAREGIDAFLEKRKPRW
ncbi:enoyl-CoA hydratase [Aquisalimonas lutea]|uniref:enoyl-CoA hydratase n=1 Tax=Aquisalimonas lutea TaxID=1327750 RepID=UPI0025B5884F|nr:enoyl-CoA hydratase [Aquisalimonas lutea]MDN3518960.1 enoyl-CoA hydratase [Aquisalimonas lutea]